MRHRRTEHGSVLFYILIAVGLLAALGAAMTSGTRSNVTSQVASNNAHDLYMQTNLIRAAIMECVLEFPEGGGDLDGDGDIDTDDNPNTPYPLEPTTLGPPPEGPNPVEELANDNVRGVACLIPGANGAVSASVQNIFQGAGNRGRFLPQPPGGFGEWQYKSDSNGVYIQITGQPDDAGTVTRLMDKFSDCQATRNYNPGTGACGTECFTAWIHRTAACP